MHSPNSWSRLWRNVFKELEGAEFDEGHLIVDTEITPLTATVEGKVIHTEHMVWSVRLT